MLQSIASDAADTYGATQPNLVLDDADKSAVSSAVEADIFWRWADEPTVQPQPLGTATIGIPFNVPFEITDGREVELFAVARSATGEQATTNPLNGTTYRYSPNAETLTPDFSQDGASANLQINFIATGFFAAKFRRIQYATNSGFTTGLVEKIEGSNTAELSPNFFISRPSGTGTLLVYVRISHSTSATNFDGDWSPTRTATFADSGGSGGSSAGDPPSDLTYFRDGVNVELSWTAGTGTNTVYRNGDSIGTGTGSFSDTLDLEQRYTYVVTNADGSSNSVSFFYYAYE